MFWFDVLRDSTIALFTAAGALGDALLVRRFSAKRQGELWERLVTRWLTRLKYPVRLSIMAAVFIASIMWTVYDTWAIEVMRADNAEQALALRIRQQFPRFPIGYTTPNSVITLESVEWMRLDTPPVPYDWSSIPLNADVFATISVRFFSLRPVPNCRAVRVRVFDLDIGSVAGESVPITYVPNIDQEPARIRLARRSARTRYVLEVKSDTAECGGINVQGNIEAEYR